MGSQTWSVVVTWAIMASMASMVASMASMASAELRVASMAAMDAPMVSLASVGPTTLMDLASVALVASRIWVSGLCRRKLSNEMLRFSPMEKWQGLSMKQTWVDGGSRSMRLVGVVKMKKELMASLIWFVVTTQSEEGADGLSDMDCLVPSMDGVDGWLRWLASKVWRRMVASMVVTGVFDTGSTDVEVPLCPQW